MNPTAKLQVDRLRGTDATLRYRADEIKLQDMPRRQMALRVQDGVLHIDPFEFRFAVLRSPVDIRGTLRHPAVGLKASKLAAQGAAAAVLGAIATAFAAIAAFVDPGLNESADCQALLADAKALGAPVRTAKAKPQKGLRDRRKR